MPADPDPKRWPSADWPALKEAVARFERAWREGPRPAIDDFLPPGPARARALVELVHIDLELRLKAGEAARVEEYLGRFADLAADRPAVVQLAAAEYEFRRRRESALSFEEYRARFPDRQGELFALIARPTVAGPPASADPPPRVVGYDVLEPLGRGGMGVVYKARQRSLDRLVALKFLPAACARDPVWLGRFRREARTASALNHPHICTIYDTGEADGRPFLSMELIDGRTLEVQPGRPRSVAEAVQLVGQAARALAAAHAAGVVHRDVKPANLMVRADGLVKVLDFGLARRVRGEGAGTDPGVRVGTVLYMSPEQARAEAVDAATDIFSLGVVLYELATGQLPFAAASEVETLHAIATAAPVRPSRLNPEVSAPLEALILRMLAKDARRRPTAVEVAAALTAAGPVPPGPGGPAAGRRPTVGREREATALHAAFDVAAAGRGSMVCVTGEPGLGKSTLVERFLDELAVGRPCRVARGRCSERLAGAEAYLPVLEALDSLLHDDAAVAAAMKLLAPTWYVQLAPPAADDPALARLRAEAKDASQERRKRELGVFLRELSAQRPLVLFLDDVHWADPSSVDLLAYLGTRCAAWPLLILLTYRPSDLLVGQHPFGPVKLNLQGRGVCREVALPFLTREDIDRYLALAFAGNRFPAGLAAILHLRTEGNPLFVVDLLRDLRDRGVVVEAADGWRLVRPLPDLQRDLPESVRGMVQRKLGQLGAADRQLLMAASVQGLEFDAAVVAELLGRDAADVEERLDVLDRVYHVVRLGGERTYPDGTPTLCYVFVHVLYQNALDAALRPSRKAAWSAATARALVRRHGKKAADLAAELATLFEAGRDPDAAIAHYLAAAQNAVRVSAHQEAVALARRGLALLSAVPESPSRTGRELALLVTVGVQLQVGQGFAAPEAGPAFARARALSEQTPDDPLAFQARWGLWMFHEVRNELGQSRELADGLLALAGRSGDPARLVQAHQALAVTSLCLGEPAATRAHADQGLALYDRQRHGSHTHYYGLDPGVACAAFGSVALWLLGFPDQAAARSRQALALAGELGLPSTLALATYFAAMLAQCRRDGPAVRAHAEALTAIATEHGFPFWLAGGEIFGGWADAEQGAGAAGVARLRRGLAAWTATGSKTYQTYYLGLLADALGREGQTEEAVTVLDEALATVGRTGEAFHAAELHRLRGDLLHRDPDGAETSLRRALEVAQRQRAKSLELRAALSLARLCQQHGRGAEGRAILTACHDGHSEGSDPPLLREARSLLDQWPESPAPTVRPMSSG